MNTKIILIAFVALLLGLVGGYYYGNLTGTKKGVEQGILQGKNQLLAEQKTVEEEKLKQIQEAANPFSETENAANPFKNIYKNPFNQ